MSGHLDDRGHAMHVLELVQGIASASSAAVLIPNAGQDRAFHRGRVEDVALLDRSLQAGVLDYNNDRPNHRDYMAGRTPLQVKKELKRRIRQTAA